MNSFTITDGWDVCERGNILLIHDEENWMNGWMRLAPKLWLQVSYRPCNYPALNISAASVSDEELAAHITKEFGNGLWFASKLNLDGVELSSDGHILGGDEDEE